MTAITMIAIGEEIAIGVGEEIVIVVVAVAIGKTKKSMRGSGHPPLLDNLKVYALKEQR